MSAYPDSLTLLPIALALAIAIASRNVILGLFVGLFCGVLMLHGLDPLAAMSVLVRDYLVVQVTDPYNAGVLVLLGFIGGFVALMEGSGGGAAFAARVTHWITNRARVQLSAWLGGIIVFFSDLGTPLIVGPAIRPLADQLRLSRAKLAYVLDSTAAPVAILVPFIGWGVYIMGLLEQQIQLLALDEGDFTALVRALPYQLYAWLAVLLVPLLALAGREIGPMRRAEAAARAGSGDPAAVAQSAAPTGARPAFVWLPLLVLGGVLLWMLVPLGFPLGRVSGADFRAGLSTAYVAAAMTLMALMLWYRTQSMLGSVRVYLEGTGRMMQVAIMLLLAWALADLSHAAGTAAYVAGLTADNVPGWALPVLVFLISAVISFATGSSWGTFAIMFPLVLPAAVLTGAPLYVCIGAVLSGGLFGDHASPISETTILSATGAGCDAFEHFQTQLPYAVGNGVLCIAGFLGAGLIANPWLVIPLIGLQVLLVWAIPVREIRPLDVAPAEVVRDA